MEMQLNDVLFHEFVHLCLQIYFPLIPSDRCLDKEVFKV